MPDCLGHCIVRQSSQPAWVFCAGLPCPSHTAIAEHMLAAVSDPMMSRCLINHVDRKGPYAGTARVSIWLLCRPSAESLTSRVFSSNPALAVILLADVLQLHAFSHIFRNGTGDTHLCCCCRRSSWKV